MVDEFGRKGRSTGSGFYDYDEAGKRTALWSGCATRSKFGSGEVPFEDLKERMFVAEALETVKCFDEGVLTTMADANIGSIFGIGFPAWTVVSSSTSTSTQVASLASSPAGWPSATATTSSRRSRWSPKAEKGEIYE
jgi:3-hydroxyacyl-CoA dehydrogenase/enoyl-CoA hydratase/3-hydroxybutyryl-CoA epimerase